MIFEGFYHIPANKDHPEIFGEVRSEAPCGCSVVVGRRQDNDEVAVGGLWCKIEHRPLVDRFGVLMAESLLNPTDRLLIDVVDELLQQAYDELVPVI